MLAYEKLGDRNNAERVRDSLATELRKPSSDPDGRRAVYFAALANADSTFFYLNRAIDNCGTLLFTAGIPCFFLFQSVDDDPRWDQTLKRMRVQRCKRR